jgi:hypothetical protein
MIKIENHCVGCDIPCNNCGLRHVPVCYCDKCGSEQDELYEYDDGQWCSDCIDDDIKQYYDEDTDTYTIDGEVYDDLYTYLDSLYTVTADDYDDYYD